MIRQLERCLGCQAFIGPDCQDGNGYVCPNCGGEHNALDMDSGGWEYNGRVWEKRIDD